VKLYSRPGNDLTDRFPLIVEALARLRSRSCILDGEAVACDENGLAWFDRIRHHRVDERVFLNVFDVQAQGLAIQVGPLAPFAQDEEPGLRGGEA
jgi:ATP-dependent DNA ligase